MCLQIVNYKVQQYRLLYVMQWTENDQTGCEHTDHEREYCWECWDSEAWITHTADSIRATFERDGDLILSRDTGKKGQSTTIGKHTSIRLPAEEALALFPEVINGPIGVEGNELVNEVFA